MRHWKYLLLSLTVFSFINLTAAQATEENVADGGNPPAAPTNPPVVADDGDKGKAEEVEVVVVKAPALKTTDRIALSNQDQTVLAMAQNIKKLIDLYKGLNQQEVTALNQLLLANEAAKVSVNLSGALIGIINHVVQAVPAQEQTGCYKCKVGMAKLTRGVKAAQDPLLSKLQKIDGLLVKFDAVIKEVEADGQTDIVEWMTTILKHNLDDDLQAFVNPEDMAKLISDIKIAVRKDGSNELKAE